LASSIEDNSAKSFTYVLLALPSELIESTTYTLNFESRKFVHIGIDQTDNFKIAVHIITASRHINITPDFLKRIFSLMNNIISFFLNEHQNYKRILFLETDTFKLITMVYNGENVLVIELTNKDGCRILLNRTDLIQLQYLEHSRFEIIVRKSVYVSPLIIKQAE